MPEPIDREAQAIAASFKPNFRPIAIGVGANLVLVGLLLGVPYVRGQRIASHERHGFATLAQCLFGGSAAKAPGFVLPLGERERFASQVIYAPSDWPLRCTTPLRALAPKAALFLWPAVKRAGADVRAAIKLVDEQLRELHRARRRGQARVSSRPLDALARLQAALTLMAEATDQTEGIDGEAVRFTAPPRLPAPARLPLGAGESAQLVLTTTPTMLEAFALDGRGVSWLQLEDGKVDRERVKRASLVRTVLYAAGVPYVVWATPEARCREREDHCAQRAMGVAPYEKGAGALVTPTWLGGHPAGRPDRVLRIDATGAVHLVARADAQGALALRRFQLPEQAQTAAETSPTPPLAAVESSPITEAGLTAGDGLWLDGQPRAIAYAAVSGNAVIARIAWVTKLQQPLALGGLAATAAATARPFGVACSAEQVHWFVYGNDETWRIARVAIDGTVSESPTQPTALDQPIHLDNPALDRVRVSCTADRALVFVLDRRDTLSLSSCLDDGSCSKARALAPNVAAFAAASTPSGSLVVSCGLAPARELRALRLDPDGAPASSPTTPAACWEPQGGLCGVPTLATDGNRIVLAARDGEDLLVVESDDAGAQFKALAGLKVGTALNPSAHDPMQQHRVRKGLK